MKLCFIPFPSTTDVIDVASESDFQTSLRDGVSVSRFERFS